MTSETVRTTTDPALPGDFTNVVPEFGRWQDVQRHFGIKRATLYNLMTAGRVKGVLLRVKGNKKGVRLFEMASVRRLILDAARTN